MEEKGTCRVRPDWGEARGSRARRVSGLCEGWRMFPKSKKTSPQQVEWWPPKYVLT